MGSDQQRCEHSYTGLEKGRGEERAEVVTCAEGTPTTLTSVESAVNCPCDEDVDWERRHQKRFNAIEFIHRSSEYIDLLGFIDEGRLRRQDLPPEPNPWSRTISKRVYEGSVQEWRRQIRDLATSTKLTP